MSATISPHVGRFVSPDSIVPGASFGAGGALGTVGTWQNSRLTVDFHETELLTSGNGENALVLLEGFWSDELDTYGPEDPQALSRYAYTLNNPIRYIDPTGHGADNCIGCPKVSTRPIKVPVDASAGLGIGGNIGECPGGVYAGRGTCVEYAELGTDRIVGSAPRTGPNALINGGRGYPVLDQVRLLPIAVNM